MYSSYNQAASRVSSNRSHRSNASQFGNNSSKRASTRDVNKNRKKLNNSHQYVSQNNLEQINTYDNLNSSYHTNVRFPVLGLKRFEAPRQEGHKNPFSVFKNTERLLMARERERHEQKKFRNKRQGFQVHKKTIANRSNRAGIIKKINDIPPGRLSPRQIRLLVKDYKSAQTKRTTAAAETNNVVQKANIFEMTEGDLENFTVGRFDQRSYHDPVVPNTTQALDLNRIGERAKSSHLQEMAEIDDAIAPYSSNRDYLKRDHKESVRACINIGRKILVTQIAINDKIEETTHLKEFIESEEEQLKEGKRLFEEDKQKFNKFLEDQENKAEEAAAITKKLAEDKQELVEQINALNKQIQDTNSEHRKIEDMLEGYVECK